MFDLGFGVDQDTNEESDINQDIFMQSLCYSNYYQHHKPNPPFCSASRVTAWTRNATRLPPPATCTPDQTWQPSLPTSSQPATSTPGAASTQSWQQQCTTLPISTCSMLTSPGPIMPRWVPSSTAAAVRLLIYLCIVMAVAVVRLLIYPCIMMAVVRLLIYLCTMAVLQAHPAVAT